MKTFQDHFSGLAGRYASYRPRYPAELFDYLATLVPRTSVVWDCAAGNGQASVGLAERFEKVIATDASSEQIRSAASHPRIEYRVAPAEASGLPDGSVGLITVAQALHWFDLDRFYAEVRRVLQPGGVLAIWAYGINVVEGEGVNDRVQHFYENVVGPYWPPERRIVEAGYQTIDFPFEEIAPPAFQMETRWSLKDLINYFGTWSATDRYLKATGHDPLQELEISLTAVWGKPESARRVAWPLSMRVGRLA